MSRAVTIAFICFVHAAFVAPGAIAELTSGDFAFDHPVASGHLRVMTWNLEVFNERNANPVHTGNPNGPRTDDQLNELAARIIGFDASIIALQEMNQVSALFDLQDRMNGGASGPWQVVAQPGGAIDQQNAFLYNDDKVDLQSSDFLSIFHPTAGLYPPFGSSYAPEAFFRAPVSGIFSPQGASEQRFRVIGIHGSYQGAEARELQGQWLATQVNDFLSDPAEPQELLLIGDMNGVAVPGQAPHDGLVSNGQLTYIAKRNGESTAIGGAMIDSIYASDAALARLTDPTSFVIRPDFYGETETEFRAAYSDHYPVFADYRVVNVPEPNTVAVILMSHLLLFRRRRNATTDRSFDFRQST